ncbi:MULTISPECIES: hypothetical protein [unclassified Geodermatophilus]|uniref:hypothetical protein n=1 Tax=unclassified Geodermatophilus TaxID=2637632 RepID=UPI003EEB5168
MRKPATLFRTAVAGAAAAVLLTACGGSGDDEPAATSSATSSSPATSSSADPSGTAAPDPAAAEFCSQVTTAFGQLESTLGTATDAEVAARLPEVISTLETVEPPADIAPDWNGILDALRRLADTAAGLDLNTPEGQQQFNDAEAQVTAELGQAQTNLTTYVVQNCALSTPAPTS